ncbi:MAG: hypothetical protein HS101_18320 [Planctomycetia bacterium]|nr:hypothetical protein [Planctomycetia bacterium]
MRPWEDIILGNLAARDAWTELFASLCEIARTTASPLELHNKTIPPDRLLAEAGWDLWQAYPGAAPRSSEALREWWPTVIASGRAVLILDAFSLREMFVLLAAAEQRQIVPTQIRVTGSEVPSDTDNFAAAMGAQSRARLATGSAPAGFALASDDLAVDVLNHPFDDSVSAIRPRRDLFVWHTWLDDILHVHERSPDQVNSVARQTIQGPGFWRFIDALRQGRRLIITSDHGYALARSFATNETDEEVVTALRDTFSASRCKPASAAWNQHLMPPVVFTHGGHHVVMGQRKWKVQGGYPYLCHGGMSLLEVAVPFVELPAL